MDPITAAELRNVSNTDRAMRARYSGRVTEAAFGRQTDMLERARRQTLRGLLGDDFDEVMGAVDGPLTGESLRKALGDRQDASSIVGAFRHIDNLNSEAIFGMNSREADRMMRARASEKEINRIFDQANVRVNFSEMAQGMGTLGGLRSITQMARDKPKNFSDFMKIALGNVDINLADDKFKDLVGNIGDISAVLSGEDKAALDALDLSGAQQAQAQLGTSRAFQALTQGRIGNRQATADEIKMAQDIFSGDLSMEARVEKASQFAAEADAAMVDRIQVESKASALAEKLKEVDGGVMVEVKKGKKEEHASLAQQRQATKRAEAMLQADKLSAIKDYVTIADDDSKEGSARAKKFRDTLAARNEALGSIEKGVDMAKDLENFWNTKGGKDGLMEKEEFNKMLRQESMANTGMGGSEQGQTNAILGTMLEMMQYFKDNMVGGKQS
jgi:hypothetical protein